MKWYGVMTCRNISRREVVKTGCGATSAVFSGALGGLGLPTLASVPAWAQSTLILSEIRLRSRGPGSGEIPSPAVLRERRLMIPLQGEPTPEAEALAWLQQAEQVLYSRAGSITENRIDAATQDANRGLVIAKENGLGLVEAAALNVLGQIDLIEGSQSPEGLLSAAARFDDAARISSENGDTQLSTRAEINAARVEARLAGADRKVVDDELMDKAIGRLRRIGDWVKAGGDAYTSTAWAHSWVDIIDETGLEASRAAFSAASTARDLAEASGDNSLMSWNYGLLGRLYARAGRLFRDAQRFEQARDYENDALLMFRRASRLATEERAPEIAYHWQWRTGDILEAQDDLDGAVAAYEAALENIEQVRLSLPEFDPQTGDSIFRRALGPIFTKLADLEIRRLEASGDSSEPQPRSLFRAREVVERLKAAEIDDYFGDACTAALLEQSIELDKFSAEGVVVLYPLLLDDRTELILTLSDGSLVSARSKMGRSDVEALAENLRKNINPKAQPDGTLGWDSATAFKEPARVLYDVLVRPIQPYLQDVDTIVFVPDGKLRLVPLAVLMDGERFLIEDFAIGTTASLKLFQSADIDRGKANILFGGTAKQVPVPNNPPNEKGEGRFPELPGVKVEREIVAPKFENAEVLLDEMFTGDAIGESISERSFNVVHVAAHGKFEKRPAESYILAWDVQLQLPQLEKLLAATRFRDQPIDLLTLTACETAEGTDQASLGIAGLAVKVGARSTIAALWEAIDLTAAPMMDTFYDRLVKDRATKASALRDAQLRVLNSEFEIEPSRDKGYYEGLRDKANGKSHPTYWSTFIVLGSWV